jgi:septum formation protein
MSGPAADLGPKRPALVLASASPRRLDLLAQIGVQPSAVRATNIDESPEPKELPRALALRLSMAKAEAARGDDALVLAADTVVGLGRRILPKAETDEEVAQCLALLSGRAHRVFSAVALAVPGAPVRVRLGEARVSFKRLSAREIAAYVASGEGRGKAGGYAIQGRAGAFVTKLSGSYSAIVGLPLYETAALLESAGFPVHAP